MNPEVVDALLAEGSVLVDEVWEYPAEYILDHGGRNGHYGWTSCGERRGVKHVHPECFPAVVEPRPQSAENVERS